MTKESEYQEAVYTYETMVEMTAHVKTMGDAGWSVISVNAVLLRATYKKNLP